MKRATTLISAMTLILVAGAAAGWASASGEQALSCAIDVERGSGKAFVEATAASRSAASGDYTFTLRGPGMNVRQGGAFEAAAGERVVLGTLSVSTGGSAYRAVLTVNAAGRSISCDERI